MKYGITSITLINMDFDFNIITVFKGTVFFRGGSQHACCSDVLLLAGINLHAATSIFSAWVVQETRV
jgi:hypothetical protein